MIFKNDRQRRAVFAHLQCDAMASFNKFSTYPGVSLSTYATMDQPELKAVYEPKSIEESATGDSKFAIGASVSSKDEDYDDESYGRKKYEVCSRCEGTGRTDPEAFNQGFTSSEMAEMGDDFEEDYFAGKYDVPCKECKGKRVTPIIVSRGGYIIHHNSIPIHEDPSGAVYFYDDEYYVTKGDEFIKDFKGDRAAAVRFIKQEEGMLPKPSGVGKLLYKGKDEI